MSRHVTFFYAPHSRASCTLALLEALHADYALHVLDLNKGEQRQAAHLAINPLGKVPAIRHGDAVVTEQVAIFIHLADLYADRGLAPAIDEPLRGPYLRWTVFYAAAFEPAIVDRSRGLDAGAAMSSPYGGYDAVVDALAGQLATGPYLLGDRFTAADVLWGTALRWALAFQLVPDQPVFRDYVERVTSRPEIVRATELDARYAAAQAPEPATPRPEPMRVASPRYTRAMRRADRLFLLVNALRGRRRAVLARELADTLGVSLRTVYRDVADLQRSGVPIEGEAGVGYVLRRGADIPPLMFDEDEIEAVVVGMRFARAFAGNRLSESATRAW